MQLALLQLESTEHGKREQARAVLEHLREDPEQRTAATRALIIDGASHHEDSQRVRARAAELQGYPDATFSDRLLYLEILRQLQDPEFRDQLVKLETDAKANATDVASLISWMASNLDPVEAIHFAESIPPEIAARWPVPLAISDAYSIAKDWPGLERVANEQNWGANDFLRHAYLARSLREQERQTDADREWSEAQKQASHQPTAVLMLAHTTTAWHWDQETFELLWTLAKGRDLTKPALEELYARYAQSGDTSGLYRVLQRSTEIAPDDLTLENNLAQVSLLLDVDVERARKIAAELAQKEPTNAAFASTYAFSLYRRGDVDGARDALENLTSEQLQSPSIAAYYGFVLAAAGEKEKARAYLSRAAGAYLLPEEKALVAKADAASR